mmetsp:Transcript_1129/g.1910  ORF Transcript_1129/g.1910 Transcript_1129/m.1910 type:complete len:207 (+) Transcript_1129:83-703(+)
MIHILNLSIRFFVLLVPHINRINHISILRIISFYPSFSIKPHRINIIDSALQKSEEANGQIRYAEYVCFDIFVFETEETRTDYANIHRTSTLGNQLIQTHNLFIELEQIIHLSISPHKLPNTQYHRRPIGQSSSSTPSSSSFLAAAPTFRRIHHTPTLPLDARDEPRYSHGVTALIRKIDWRLGLFYDCLDVFRQFCSFFGGEGLV